MEPSPKRQRLYTPHSYLLSRSSQDYHRYYDIPDTEIEDSEDYDDDDDEEEEEEGEEDGANIAIYDPDFEHNLKRAQAEHKLKSTFEAIFQKYGKDFDGIGDEIDLATGDIVVNNGHLIEMQNEQDAGDIRGPRQELEVDTTQSQEDFHSLVGDDNSLGESGVEEEEDQLNEDGMVEDDMILRGFTQATRFLQPDPYLPMHEGSSPPMERICSSTLPRPSLQSMAHPPRHKIRSQFRPKPGPQVFEYDPRQHAHDDNRIEPAWRVPEIPGAPLSRHSRPKATIVQRTICRSPSPDNGPSLWAPSGQRRRRRTQRSPNCLNFDRPPSYRPGAMDSLGTQSMITLEEHIQNSRPSPHRNPFTAADDDLLVKCVRRVRKHNVAFWKDVEAKYPHHTWKSWRWRYYKYSTYCESSPPPETGTPTSTTPKNVYNVLKPNRPHLSLIHTIAYQSGHKSDNRRPRRERKPSQKDSNIVSWSEAVNSIKSLDPELHSGILHDIRKNNDNEGYWDIDQLTPAKRYVSNNRLSKMSILNQKNNPQHDHCQISSQPKENHSDLAYHNKYQLGQLPDFDNSTIQDGNFNLIDSDIVSQGRANDSPNGGRLSSTSEHDPTLTPQGMSNRASYTPMTSISSPMANQPSDKINDAPGVDIFQGVSSTFRAQIPVSNLSANYGTGQQLSENHIALPKLDTPISLKSELEQALSRGVIIQEDSRANDLANLKIHEEQHGDTVALLTMQNTPIEPLTSLPSSIPDSQSSTGSIPVRASRLNWRQQNISKNPIYHGPCKSDEATDDRCGPRESLALGLPPNRTRPTAAQTPFKTPTRKHPRKYDPIGSYNLEEVDELSLDSDDIVLLSSHRRTTKRISGLSGRMKREDIADRPQIISVASSKRRIPSNRHESDETDEIDELMGDEPVFSSSTKRPVAKPQSQIKLMPSTSRPFSKGVKPNSKTSLPGRRKSSATKSCLHEVDHLKKKAHKDKEFVQAPILKVTPTRHANQATGRTAAVPESVSGSSIALSSQPSASRKRDQPQPTNARANSFENSSLLAARKKADYEAPTDGPTIVVKTPGGTFRSCGKDGFACKKSFCFRCCANPA